MLGTVVKRVVVRGLRLTCYGVLCGLVSGLACGLYLHLLKLMVGHVSGIPFFYFSLPLVFVLCTWVNKSLLSARLPDRQGTDIIIEKYNTGEQSVSWVRGSLKAVLSIVTIAAGGSAGKEGPSSYLAATLCTSIAQFFELDARDVRIILLCGMAAGFAAVFGAPVASAVFALEVMVVWRPQIKLAYPALLASALAVVICRLMGISYFTYPLELPVFDLGIMVASLLCALFVGAIAALYVFFLWVFRKLAGVIRCNYYIKAFSAGLLVALCGMFFGGETLGLGEEYFENVIQAGTTVLFFIPLLKIGLTSLTLNWGGVGGVITPMAFIGITAGSFFGGTLFEAYSAPIMGVDMPPSALFAAIGLVVVFSVCCKTPVAALVLAVEMFGCSPAVYFLVIAGLSCVVSWRLSIFESQIRIPLFTRKA